MNSKHLYQSARALHRDVVVGKTIEMSADFDILGDDPELAEAAVEALTLLQAEAAMMQIPADCLLGSLIRELFTKLDETGVRIPVPSDADDAGRYGVFVAMVLVRRYFPDFEW